MKLLRRPARRRASAPSLGITRSSGSLQIYDVAAIRQILDKRRETFSSTTNQRAVNSTLWILLVLLGACATLFFTLNNWHIRPRLNSTQAELPGGHRIFLKSTCGSIDAPPLLHPTSVIVISQSMNSVRCKSLSECSHNFVIWTDGHIYEDLGWDAQGYYKDMLDLCFVGDFDNRKLSFAEEEATLELLKLGVKMNKISPDYKIIGENQAEKSVHLGKHILQVISRWQHWAPDLDLT